MQLRAQPILIILIPKLLKIVYTVVKRVDNRSRDVERIDEDSRSGMKGDKMEDVIVRDFCS